MRDAYGFWLRDYLNKALVGAVTMVVAAGFAFVFAATPAPHASAAAGTIHMARSHQVHRDLSRQALDQYGGWQMNCTPLTPTTGICWDVVIDGPGY